MIEQRHKILKCTTSKYRIYICFKTLRKSPIDNRTSIFKAKFQFTWDIQKVCPMKNKTKL